MKNVKLRRFDPLAARLSHLPRKAKRVLMICADCVMVPLALWCAIGLRFGSATTELAGNLWLYVLAVAFVIPFFIRFGLYRAVVRFMGSQVVGAVVNGVLLSVIAFGLAVNFLTQITLPLSVLAMFGVFCLLYVGGSRFAIRLFLERQRAHGDRVVIYGAGGGGANLATALASNRKYTPVAFIDDNMSLWGSVINGVEVYAPEKLTDLIETLGIKRVLLAVPSASKRRRRKLIEQLEELPIHVQTIPDMADLVSGVTQVDEIKEVDVADLLGRDAVPPNRSLLGACIHNRNVMITGAGGSIGSELCRQIIRQNPKRMLLLENSELALYNINKELCRFIDNDGLETELVPLLCSVENKMRVREAMIAFEVQTVYHAAAYKHVPMVEQNIIAGVCNNVIGTLHCAEAAIDAKVETFVLISTDKAVCPTNVMGATKRLAEMVLQALDDRGSSTCFCMVRFGNVLASSGSVVPLFREQIQRGGPVTVTHRDIIRYFMTIPEAAQLVIQAGSMGKGGDVFLLDMGKPIRIGDLARRMIHLMGLTVLDDENPDGDIEIKYTGLRPAEKLYEELLIGTNVMGTEHPMIMRAEEKLMPWVKMRAVIDELLEAASRYDSQKSREILGMAVDEYTPSNEIVDLVWTRRQETARLVKPVANVSSISAKSGV